VTMKDGKNIIVKDWIESNEYDAIYSSIYSPNWKSFAYDAQKDWKIFIVKTTCSWETKNTSEVNITLKNYTNQLIISKTKLNKTTSWKSQIKSIDILINKQTTEKLEIIFKNIWPIKSKMNQKTKNKYADLLDYLEASIWIKLWK
jgi:hypothetical protein